MRRPASALYLLRHLDGTQHHADSNIAFLEHSYDQRAPGISDLILRGQASTSHVGLSLEIEVEGMNQGEPPNSTFIARWSTCSKYLTSI